MKDFQLAKQGTVYALKHTDEVRLESTSGGAFTAISDVILRQSGYIAGATYDQDMNIVHKLTNTVDGRDAMRGSKYVQSDLNTVPLQIQQLLQDGQVVLFVGTPCQVSALNEFLKHRKVDATNLTTCDFVCHGVPSPKIIHEYFQLLQGDRKLTDYRFRDKANGWHGHREKPVFEGENHKYNSWLTKANVRLFETGYIERPSCYNCDYANVQRQSDITIGDCWGIEKIDPEYDDNKGLSLVMINTDKGRNVICRLDESVQLKEYTLSDLMQPRLRGGFAVPAEREVFWKYYREHGLEKSLKKYAKYGLEERVWYYSSKLLQKLKVKKLAKKIMKV